MFGIQKYITGAMIGIVLGLWMGVNIGKDQPIWANPFAERALTKKASDKASDILKNAKKAVRDSLDD